MKPYAYRRCGRQCLALLAGAALAALVLASAAGAAAPEANEWPAWRGPDHTGISAETGWRADWSAEPPKTLWKAKVGQGFSAVSVAGGRLYTMGNTEGTDTVWCLNPDSGEVIWKHSYPCKPHDHPGSRCTPTVDGDVVYTLSNQGDLFCLEAATGKVKWNGSVPKDLGAEPSQWGFACSPLVLGKMLVLDVGPTVALDKATGKEIWKSGSDKAGYGSPYAFQVGGETLIATFPEFGPRVVKAADGKELGRVRWKTAWGVNAVTPIIEGNTMFISSGYNVGAAVFEVSADGLKPLWQNKNMRNHANNCVLWKGYLYGFDGQVNEGPLTCIEYKTGEKKWSEGSLKAGGLMMADGKLVLMASSGECAVVEAAPDACKILGRIKVLDGTCWTQPILVGGRIYCRNHPGDLVCLDVRAK